MVDSVDCGGTSEPVTPALKDVVLFLVDGTPEAVDAFAKRANSGCFEPRDNEMVIKMDLVPQPELAELLQTIHLQLSEMMMGQRLSADCCELLVRRSDDNYRICPKFYNLIAEHKIGDIRIDGSVVIMKPSLRLKEWQRKKLRSEGFKEKSRSNIPIAL